MLSSNSTGFASDALVAPAAPSATAAAANLDPAVIKAVVDAVFGVLETLTITKPIAYGVVKAAHALFDQMFTAQVANQVKAKLRNG